MHSHLHRKLSDTTEPTLTFVVAPNINSSRLLQSPLVRFLFVVTISPPSLELYQQPSLNLQSTGTAYYPTVHILALFSL